LGIGAVDDFTHIPYGYVGLKDASGAFKKMSSRAGTAIVADDVIDQVKETILDRFNAESRHDPAERDDLAEKLALCAVKFAFLKSDSKLDLSFDINESVDVQGDSGLYVMYTYVRTQSVLAKAGSVVGGDVKLPDETGATAELLRTLLYYEFAVADSVKDLSVHHISQYLLELSRTFNSWYAKETILDGGEDEAFKLALLEAVAVTIENGFRVIGIETVSEM
jgi:arginyl-tRNA synthetase